MKPLPVKRTTREGRARRGLTSTPSAVVSEVADAVFAGLAFSVSVTVKGRCARIDRRCLQLARRQRKAPVASVCSASPPGGTAPSTVRSTVEFGVKPEALIAHSPATLRVLRSRSRA